MRRKLLRIALIIMAIQAICSLIGLLISKRMKRGDETSDDFQVAAVLGGRSFASRATNLRSATVISTLGGVDLDLRNATLDPEGANLDLKLTLGGAQVTVPPDWAVDVDVEGQGGFEVDVTPVEDLPDDAPKLHIHALARAGGGQVVTASA